MEKQFDLSVYLKELNSVKSVFDNIDSRFNMLVKNLKNYLKQVNSVNRSEIFTNDELIVDQFNKNDLKIKLQFKLNLLINETSNEISAIL